MQLNIESIYRDFFKSIDEKVNVGDMSCHEFAHLYLSFFEELKNWRGTSAGFTGLSEFLVFRLIVNLLGGSFKVEPITNDLKKYVRGDLQIEQGHRIHLKEPLGSQKYIVPDLTIFKEDILKSVISVKVYPLSSNSLKEEIRKLLHLKSEHSDLRVLLIIYYAPLTKPVQNHLDEIEKDNTWLKHKGLRYEHNEKIRDVVSWVLKGLL